jgi:hypothetical protein
MWGVCSHMMSTTMLERATAKLMIFRNGNVLVDRALVASPPAKR